MYYHYLTIIVLICLVSSSVAQQLDNHCFADQKLLESKKNDPTLAAKLMALEDQLQQQINSQNQIAQSRAFSGTIPVVVHILWQEEGENLSDELIHSQLRVLNEDFQQRNINRVNVPDDFAPMVANIGLEFCLAAIDPDGQPTTGIIRTQTTIDCIGNINETKQDGQPRLFYESLGGSEAWDTEHYLNIWVAPTCGAFLGFGVFPGSSIPEEDGVVIDSKYFGVRSANSAAAPYHLGRTTTHEVGHYFNLKHTWGETGCEVDDLVADTPLQEKEYRGCPIHPNSSCDSPDMFMNFMNYVDDECLMFFTKGQKERILASLAGPRAGLLDPSFCLEATPETTPPFTVFPNPARDCLNLLLDGQQGEFFWELFDATGRSINLGIANPNEIYRISLQNLASGIYFVKVKLQEEEYTKKVLILPESF